MQSPESPTSAATIGRPEPRWSAVATVLWGILIAVVFVLLQVIVSAAFIEWTNPGASEEEFERLIESADRNGTILGVATCASTLVCVPLILGVIRLKRGASVRSCLGMSAVDRRQMIRWILALFAFIVATDLLSLALDRPIVPEFLPAIYSTASPRWLLWLALLACAPLFEEMFFRGFLYGGLEASRLGAIGAILITSILWAIVHAQYGAYEIATIVCLGVLLGAARFRTGSIVVPLVLHSLANLVATIEMLLTTTATGPAA
jgi:membrane protease YdiL (CAAX protease family)